MSRVLWTAVLLSLVSVSLVRISHGQIAKQAVKAPAPSAAEKKLLDNPDDVAAYMTYMSEISLAVAQLSRNTEAALARLDAADEIIAKLKPTQADAMMRLSMLKSSVDSSRSRVLVQNVSLKELEQKVEKNPDDAQAIKLYTTKLMSEISLLARTKPDAAEKQLDAAKAVLEKAKQAATSDATKRQLTTTNGTVSYLERAIATGRLTFAELGDKLKESPNDMRALSDFYGRIMTEVSPLVRSKPAEAEEKIDLARGVFREVSSNTTNKSISTMIGNYQRTLDSMSKSMEAGKKLTEMIGKEAAPLAVERWVNGSPLTDADLKGKVVFLDFWAVWCGPCIATFPHLKEWNEKYADKGLVMIGLTRYYNYQWDAAADKATRATEKVPKEDEVAMLGKFAEQHELKHRFAIQADSSLSDYYGVTGIPHVVVIDREGKIRLMKVGSGEANAKEIGALLEELLGG